NLKAMRREELLEGSLITRPAVEALQKRIAAVRKRLSERRGDLRQGNTWASCDNDASSLAKTLSVSLESAWRRFIETQVTDTSSLTTFRQVPSCKGPLKKVDELNTSLRSRSFPLPTTRKEIA